MAYLLFTLKKFSFSVKKQLLNPKKIYCIDNAIIGLNAFTFTENRGRLLENAVFLQLKRNAEDIFYHRVKYECDFLVKKGLKITQAIQVCDELHSDNQNRELRGLTEALSLYGLKEGLLLTRNDEDRIKVDDLIINIVPVWKWLLND